MKKLLLTLFVLTTMVGYAFADDNSPDGVYLMLDFDYIPHSDINKKLIADTGDGYGIGFTIGYLSSNWWAVEFSTLIDFYPTVKIPTAFGGTYDITQAGIDNKLFALFQPSFGVSSFSLMPYAGGGLMLSQILTVEDDTLDASGALFGLGAKAGLRAKVLFLMLDVGVEYGYRFSDTKYVNNYETFTVNAGIGIIF